MPAWRQRRCAVPASAVNFGTGDVAWLNIDNPNNTGNVISASTNGLGPGASFRIDNPLNTQQL